MHRMVEIAANPGSGNATGVGLQAELPPNRHRLPVEPRVQPGPVFPQCGLGAGRHGHRKTAVGGNLLVTGELPRQAAGITYGEAERRNTPGIRAGIPRQTRASMPRNLGNASGVP